MLSTGFLCTIYQTKKTMFFCHFRTTVNRRTLAGRVGRTNEGRVWFSDTGDDVVTKHPVKSVVLLSYIDESLVSPTDDVWAIGRAVPAVVIINCCDCWEEGTVASEMHQSRSSGSWEGWMFFEKSPSATATDGITEMSCPWSNLRGTVGLCEWVFVQSR